MRRPGRWPALWALAALALLAAIAVADDLDDFIDSVEAVVNEVADAAAMAHRGREEAVEDCECSLHACGSAFRDSHECRKELGTAPACGNCTGQKLDFDNSFVLTPPGTNIDAMGSGVKDSICTFRKLDSVFLTANVHSESGGRAWTYVATTDGVMRSWPGRARERGDGVNVEDADEGLGSCKIYDPRTRPWYGAATSGPKDVVVLIDTSRTMLEPDNPFVEGSATRWDNARAALLNLLDTFSLTDHVNVVEFSDAAFPIVPGGLVPATNENVEQIKEALEIIRPQGDKDFRVGLDAAFDVLIKASKTADDDKPRTANCQKVIIFLTDGHDCTTTAQNCTMNTPEGSPPVDAVHDFVAKQQDKLEATGSERAHIFPVSFGLDGDDKIPKQLACANEGVWGRIMSGDDPLVVLHAYTSYLASRRRDAGVVWTRQYADEFGLGPVFTAAKPIHGPRTSRGEGGALLGVAGHDVRVEDFQALSPKFEGVVQRLETRRTQCNDTNFSACELPILRGRSGECPEDFMSSMCYYFDKTDSFYIAPDTPLLPYDKADVFCQSLGGKLAEMQDTGEEELVTGLASNSGSWIGLRRDGNFVWRWASSGVEVEPTSELWAFTRGLNDAGKACGSVDRRGVRHSVEPADCTTEARFICEFAAEAEPDVCTRESDLVRVDKDYEYAVRPLSTCKTEDEALLVVTEATAAAELLPPDRVVCPLGEPATTFKLQCCAECPP